MRRLRGLLLKEIWNHGFVLLLVFAFIGCVQVLLLLGTAVGPRTITMLEAHAMFMRAFLPLLGLALGHRLVVREYHARTQRFLEALPLHRWEVLLTKFFVGLVVLGLAVTVSLACASFIALFKEPLTLHWLTLIFVRSQVFALTLFSVFFLMGLLGRWRIPVYMAGGLLLLFLDQGTELDVSRFGPFGLVGQRLVLERLSAPWTELGVSLMISALALGISGALTLLDEGSVAESLAKRMSRRERVAVGVVLALALIAWEVADPAHEKEPFSFGSEAVLLREEANLSVLYRGERHRGDAEALAQTLSAVLVTARRELGHHEPFSPVHIALRSTLEPHEFESVPLEETEDGVLVRANFTDPDFDPARFRAFVLERTFEHASDGRAAFEPHAWVRSGTAGLLAGSSDLRAASFYRRYRRPTYASLERIERTRERFGSDVARALATSAALVFEQEHGHDAWMSFASEVLDDDPPPGVFAAFAERRESVRERFERAVGSRLAFEEQWRQSLRRQSLRVPAEIPLATAWVRVEVEEGHFRTIRWGARFASPPPVDAVCSLLHAGLGPFDEVLERDEVQQDEVLCSELAEEGRRLVGRYAEHDRVFLAVELRVSHARVRLLADRRELD